MPRGHLLCPLFLTMADKRPFQGAVNGNLRLCRYYFQVLEDSWGPPQRDLERDWVFAQRCLADPELPMRELVTFFKAPMLPHKVDPAIVEFRSQLMASGGPHREYGDLEQFREAVRPLLARWVQSVIDEA